MNPGHKRRAVIIEPHPVVRAVLEHILVREGYIVEALDEPATGEPAAGASGSPARPGPGPALLLVSLKVHDGLYVLQSREPAVALESFSRAEGCRIGEPELSAAATGMHAHLPRPFGAEDVLRAVRAVSGFDGRRRLPEGLR